MPETSSCPHVLCEVRARVGLITLNRPRALGALSLEMVRALDLHLRAWQKDDRVLAVLVRGTDRNGEPFGNFCAGGDIRFLHAAATSGNPALEDFFTEEYALTHFIHRYPKPYIAFMDGIVMGGGMGISQGAGLRIVTERSQLAMPETLIGLFPDVGGGWFLARCPGRVGEFLGLTGHSMDAAEALEYGLADGFVDSARLGTLWEALAAGDFAHGQQVLDLVRECFSTPPASATAPAREAIDACFAQPTVRAIVQALRETPGPWAQDTVRALERRSPLMLHVVLEQIRRVRGGTPVVFRYPGGHAQTRRAPGMPLADDLRMERDLVRHCFHLRPGQSETVEGIRALAVDKDHRPHWHPAHIDDVPDAAWQAFFHSPWPVHAHPLRHLSDAGWRSNRTEHATG